VNSSENDRSTSLIVGNPRLPSGVSEQWGWGDIGQAEQEASLIAEIMQTTAMIGLDASKEAVMAQVRN
jgi:hypothetical protein